MEEIIKLPPGIPRDASAVGGFVVVDGKRIEVNPLRIFDRYRTFTFTGPNRAVPDARSTYPINPDWTRRKFKHR